jgi:hypothetical protein
LPRRKISTVLAVILASTSWRTIDAAPLPLRALVRLLRQRQQGLTIKLFEKLTAAASQPRRVRSLRSTRRLRIASLRAASEKKRRFLSRARI